MDPTWPEVARVLDAEYVEGQTRTHQLRYEILISLLCSDRTSALCMLAGGKIVLSQRRCFQGLIALQPSFGKLHNGITARLRWFFLGLQVLGCRRNYS